MSIDVKNWKQFRLGDFFEIERGTSRVMRDLLEGDVPIIAAARAEQGVAGFYDVQAEYSDEITVSCNGVGCGSVFYHRGSFAITGDSAVMKSRFVFSENTKLFIAAVCDSLFSVKYSYAEKCNPAGLSDELIFLPATSDGVPDWAYMDAYMSEIMRKEEAYAEQFVSLTEDVVSDGYVLDTSMWRAFRIGSLFEIHPTKAYSMNNSELFSVDGINPVVVNSAQNNGIGGFTGLPVTESGKVITFSDTTDANSIFYQSESFVGYPHVQGMYPKFNYVSDFVMLFIVSAFRSQAVRMNFDYANKFRRDIAVDILIRLPVTSSGDPDWAFMEWYMQQQMDKAVKLVDHLDVVWNEGM